jgi:four helix bundle protein
MNQKNKDNIILTKTFDFALRVIEVYKVLYKQHEFVLSKQLLRSATSIGANAEEAIAGQSLRDFTAKMSIASKEARETHYWLRLISASKLTDRNVQPLIDEVEEIKRILVSIVKTSQEKLRKP